MPKPLMPRAKHGDMSPLVALIYHLVWGVIWLYTLILRCRERLTGKRPVYKHHE